MKVTTQCKQCNQSFEHEHWQNRKYCSRTCYTQATIGIKREFTDEWKQNLSKAMKGREPWNKGLTGEEYAEHYLKGFPGMSNKGNEPWNKGLTGEEYATHYTEGFKGGFYKGHTPWNKNKKGVQVSWNKGLNKKTDERLRKISDNLKGIPKSKEHRRKLSKIRKKMYDEGILIPPNLGKTFSEEIRKKLSQTRKRLYAEGKLEPMAGEKNPMWKGGRCPYYGYNWNKQRRKTLKRDKRTCQVCGEEGYVVHHIIPMREYLDAILDTYTMPLPKSHMRLIPYETLIPKLIFEEANDLKNLVTCCEPCHRVIEPTFKK